MPSITLKPPKKPIDHIMIEKKNNKKIGKENEKNDAENKS